MELKRMEEFIGRRSRRKTRKSKRMTTVMRYIR